MMKILVITSCSKSKLSYPAKARYFYQGDIFKKVQAFVEKFHLEEIIISSKLGIVELDDILEPYDDRLKNLGQARRLRPKVIPFLEQKSFDCLILILGNIYLEVIKHFLSNLKNIPIYRMMSNNGIFDYKQNMMKLLNNDFSVLAHYAGMKIDFENLLEENK
jgi:uncharacterized protein DUF6884